MGRVGVLVCLCVWCVVVVCGVLVCVLVCVVVCVCVGVCVGVCGGVCGGVCVGVRGGVYKGQGRNQRKLMTCAYWEFLVQGKQLQFPIPSTSRVQRITSTFRIMNRELISS